MIFSSEVANIVDPDFCILKEVDPLINSFISEHDLKCNLSHNFGPKYTILTWIVYAKGVALNYQLHDE